MHCSSNPASIQGNVASLSTSEGAELSEVEANKEGRVVPFLKRAWTLFCESFNSEGPTSDYHTRRHPYACGPVRGLW